MSHKIIEGELQGANQKLAIVVGRFNSFIGDALLRGALDSLKRSSVKAENITVAYVPGAFEMPLIARDLAQTGKYAAVICAAFVVDGGIYRHDFVAAAVVDGLMRASLDTGVPVLSVSLTPHHYQETEHHNAIYRDHFVTKGHEAAQAALSIVNARAQI